MTDFAIKATGPDEYEGLMVPYGGPRNGRDLSGTYFAKKGDVSWPAGTDFCLDWFPGGEYPLLFEHGGDGAIKAAVVGRWSFKAWDDAGGWSKIQLDKAHAYHDEIAGLIEQGALKLSSGAVDHVWDWDRKTGAIKLWPLVEGSLTTIPANPDQPPVGYAVKSLDATEHLAVLGVALPAEAAGEVVVPATKEETAPNEAPVEPAVKAGARNNATDQAHLNQAHQAAHDTMTQTLAAGAVCDTCTEPDSDDAPDGAGKSIDTQPASGLAVKAGTNVERMSDADLAAFKQTIQELARTEARKILAP